MPMLEAVTLRFMDAHPEDAARVLETLPASALSAVIRDMPPDSAARVLRHVTPDALAGCLRDLGDAAAPVVQHLPVAIASPALRALDAAPRRRLLDALPKTVSVPLGLALRYPPGTVGALLDPQAVCAHAGMSMGETVQLARKAPELLRRYVYVLDDHQQLAGVLDVRECLLAPRHVAVRSLMRPDPVSLRARASLAEAAAHRAWTQLDVLPVVDRGGTFLGVLRRRVLDAARAAPGEAGAAGHAVTGTVLDLADLYWQASTAVFLGDRESGKTRRGR